MRRRAFATLALCLLLLAACTPQTPAKTPAELALESLERGVQADNAGKNDDAIAAYFETLGRNPRSAVAYYNLGQLFRRSNELVIAEGYYRQALKVDPNYTAAQFGFGFTRLAVGAWAEAEDANRKVIAAEPNNGAAHYNLGLALRGQGRDADAQAAFQRASQLDPRLVPPAPAATPAPTATPRR